MLEFLNTIALTAHSHAHDHGDELGVWESTLHILTDPGHLIAELIFTIFFDLVVVFFFYKIVLKKIIIPRLRKDIHKEIDASHGIDESSHVVSKDKALKNL